MKLIKRLIFLAVVVWVGLFVFGLIKAGVEDRKEYPGKTEFEAANKLINVSSNGVAHGNTPEAKAAAAQFASSMKSMQSIAFTGSAGRMMATGGEFLTYIHQDEKGMVVLCHVPGLRKYKDKETRDALATIAWTCAQGVAKSLPGLTGEKSLIVGLRGFASYGPIWEGTVRGEATTQTDDIDGRRRLYPFFVQPVATTAATP